VNNLLVSCALCLSLAGCVSPTIQSLAQEDVANRTHANHDEFRKLTRIPGIRLTFGEFGESGYWLNCVKPDATNEQPSYSICLDTLRGHNQGWAFWSQAFDENGVELPKIADGSDVAEGVVYERVYFRVARHWLDSASTNAIKVRVDGKRAQQLLSFPTNYVAGFLSKVDLIK
jgi:hypothetical protein